MRAELVDDGMDRSSLFNTAINVSLGKPEERHLTTGLHTVQDVSCTGCSSKVGWRYQHAHDASQK
jgi:hypothetical protein